MHRVDNDARQPRAVEHPLLEIEFPAAVLLREQEALKLVGKARNDALHARKLLVEKVAQPRQFVGIAQIGRGNGFVELRGKYLVSPLRRLREGQVLPPLSFGGVTVIGVSGLAGLFAAELARCFLSVFTLGFGLLTFSRFSRARFSIRTFLRLFFRLAGFLAFAFGVVAEIVTNLQVFEDGTGQLREGFLVAIGRFNPRKIGARALLDPATPRLDGGARAFRRRKTGDALAYKQRHDLRKRRVGALARLGYSGR